MTPQTYAELLQLHADAWNAHDVDALLALMTDDCIYDAAAGVEPFGKRFAGKAELRSAFTAIWTTYPDSQWAEPTHLVEGDRGITTWTFRATKADGSKMEVLGLDIIAFRDGRISHKDTYRKNVTR